MTTLDLHHDFDVPAQRIWLLVEDFGNIERWWPKGGAVAIQRVDLEGDGVGMVRHIYNEGMPAPISEKLVFLDADNLTYKLSIVGNRPAGLLEYLATGVLKELGPGKCRLEYHAEFVAEDGRVEEAKEFLLHAYALMYQGLAQTVTEG